MKGDAIYVNIGRGTTTNQEALVKALGCIERGGANALETGSSDPQRAGRALFLAVLRLGRRRQYFAGQRAHAWIHWRGGTRGDEGRCHLCQYQ
jgi:hypothetical protein